MKWWAALVGLLGCCVFSPSATSTGGEVRRAVSEHSTVTAAAAATVPATVSAGGRKKIRLHSAQSSATDHYGVELPNFAFDYSELISSAILEQTDGSHDLYLTIFLLGHQTVFKVAQGISALQTEQDTLIAWNRVAKAWDRSRLSNQTRTSRSRLFCILQHNDGGRSLAYQAPAHWLSLNTQPSNASSAFRGSSSPLPSSSFFGDAIEVVRCKLRGHANHTALTSRRLSVDLVRKDPLRNETDRRGETLVLSFSLSWADRMAGYGSASVRSPDLSAWTLSNSSLATDPQRRSPRLAPSQNTAVPQNSNSTGIEQTATLTRVRNASSTPFIVHACVPGVRPLRPQRPDVPIAALLEFVAHLRSLSVRHVTLGLVLDPAASSLHMSRHVAALQDLLNSGLLSLAPMSMPRLDDVPGLAGVMLTDSLAETFFLNHCLAASKGIADYVLVMRPHQFLAPGMSLRDLVRTARLPVDQAGTVRTARFSRYAEAGEGPLGSWAVPEAATAARNASISGLFTRPRAKTRTHHPGAGHTTHAPPVPGLEGKPAPPVSCSVVVEEAYAAADPADQLFPPSDGVWTRDYFAKAPLAALPRGTHAVHLLHAVHTVGVEVDGRTGATVPVCKASASTRVVQRIAAGWVMSFVEALPPTVSQASPTPDAVLRKREEGREAVFRAAHAELDRLGLADLQKIQSGMNAFMEEFKNQHGGASGAVLASHDRNSVREPFWRLCQTQTLTAAAERVFQ